jgi:hypothetical protein
MARFRTIENGREMGLRGFTFRLHVFAESLSGLTGAERVCRSDGLGLTLPDDLFPQLRTHPQVRILVKPVTPRQLVQAFEA